jgi:hypothetical protein
VNLYKKEPRKEWFARLFTMVTIVLLFSLLASIALAYPPLGGEWPIGGHEGLGVAVGVYVGPFGQYGGMSIQKQIIIRRV